MDKLEALTALRDKVKRGVDTADDHAAAFPSESAGGHCTWHDSYNASTNGSLDAAKALHAAVLPEWMWAGSNAGSDGDKPLFMVAKVVNGTADERDTFEAGAENPARAWLLAILEALIEMETDNET